MTYYGLQIMEEFAGNSNVNLSVGMIIPQFYNHGCQAGSMRHRLSGLIAAPTNVVTLVSAPSNSAKSETGLDRTT